jgi:hypothetical protein
MPNSVTYFATRNSGIKKMKLQMRKSVIESVMHTVFPLQGPAGRKQSNVCSTHFIAKNLLTNIVKSAIRKMCYWEKTHNLSEYMSTKLLVKMVPDYMDMMIPCWGQHVRGYACEKITLACLRNRHFTYEHVQRKIANIH